MKAFFLFSAFSLVLVSFQNCSPPLKSQDLNFQLFQDKSENNGHGYSGKPGLYRFVANYQCGDSIVPEMIALNENGERVLIKTSSDNGCKQTIHPLDPNLFSYSKFQSEFVPYNDFLFTNVPEPISQAPKLLAESLCRDDFDKPTFEITSHYNGDEQFAKVQFYGPELSSVDNSNPVGRLFTSQSVTYKTKIFSLEIDLSAPIAPGTFRYNGMLDLTGTSKKGPLNSAGAQKSLTCILGGGLDTSLFSFQKLIPDTIQYLAISETNTSQAFEKVPGYFGSYLIKKDAQKAPSLLSKNGEVIDLANDSLKNCVQCAFVKMNLSSPHFVVADTPGTRPGFYSVDLKDLTSIPIDISDSNVIDYWVLNHFTYFFTTDSEKKTYSVLSFDIKTGQLKTLLSGLTNNFSFAEGKISKANSTLLIYAKFDPAIPLIVVDDATNSARVTTAAQLGLPTAMYAKYGYYNVWGGLEDITGSTLMSLPQRASLDINNFDTDIYYFDPVRLLLRKQWSVPAFYSRQHLGKYLLGCNTAFGLSADCQGTDDALIDLQTGGILRLTTGASLDLIAKANAIIGRYIGFIPVQKVLRFFNSGDYLYVGQQGPGQQYVINIITREQKSICAEYNNNLFLSFFKSQSVGDYMLMFNSSEHSLSILRLNGTSCKLQSKFPLGSWGVLKDFLINSAGVGFIFDSIEFGAAKQYVVFAPMNGRPPILMNAAFSPITQAEQMLSEENQVSFYLMGTDSRTGLRNIFKFKPY